MMNGQKLQLEFWRCSCIAEVLPRQLIILWHCHFYGARQQTYASHGGMKDKGLAPPVPASKVHMLLVWLKLPHSNVLKQEHEQDKFRAPSFWASTNKNQFIASMFLFTFFS